MSVPIDHAAALMSADQYRQLAQMMLGEAETCDPDTAPHFLACAQVYATLAVSAQLAENRTDVPF